MKIAVINKKGGVGKTPFAFSISKDLNMYLQSNDNSCIEEIYPEMAKVSDEVVDIDDCVYDFGGFVASGVADIIKKCDCIIVPCVPHYNSFLRSIETIKEVEELNKNIIILATDFVDFKEEKLLEKELGERYKKYPIFYFKKSKIVNHATNTGLSFTELYEENPLARHNYTNFINEYRRLINQIRSYKKD